MTSCPEADVRVGMWSIEELHAALALAARLCAHKRSLPAHKGPERTTKAESCRCCRESDNVNPDVAVNFSVKVQMRT